ncbi:uncharacterized protein V6R79_003690 [Siganus canaliculatus]
MNENINSNSGAETLHTCDLSCLGPLTFHHQAVGDKVYLRRGRRLAERMGSTFKNGLVFSSRPLKIQERVRLRVEKHCCCWQGVLRVGYTSMPPSTRPLPLPPMAIPDLTDRPGHWAASLPESFCGEGSELEFWVSCEGTIYASSNSSGQQELLTGVDLRQPLWAMIDLYGQTCSVLLLGSEKRGLFHTRRSCPAPECHISTDHHHSMTPDGDECMEVSAGNGSVMDCVVCLRREARVTLPCGHQCLCQGCAPRVVQQFGCCPLCRVEIDAPVSSRPPLDAQGS